MYMSDVIEWRPQWYYSIGKLIFFNVRAPKNEAVLCSHDVGMYFGGTVKGPMSVSSLKPNSR
jgi:hypothetical protein